MSAAGWEPDEDRASQAEILAHLVRCDARFVPPLSERVDLPAYAARLHAKSRRFEAWSGGRLVGLVAAYLDGQDGGAFISNVSVEVDFLGRGIASALLGRCILRARAAGLRRVRLEVGADNEAARRLYEKQGFSTCADGGDRVFMQLDLPEATP